MIGVIIFHSKTVKGEAGFISAGRSDLKEGLLSFSYRSGSSTLVVVVVVVDGLRKTKELVIGKCFFCRYSGL